MQHYMAKLLVMRLVLSDLRDFWSAVALLAFVFLAIVCPRENMRCDLPPQNRRWRLAKVTFQLPIELDFCFQRAEGLFLTKLQQNCSRASGACHQNISQSSNELIHWGIALSLNDFLC